MVIASMILVRPSQTWMQRTQLDVMRTVCYHPGPILMPDLSQAAVSDIVQPDLPEGSLREEESAGLRMEEEVGKQILVNG
jgi:hypothetical protein